jgi:DNA-binding response OmpR family regulator
MSERDKALILVVEDDRRLSHANCHALESEGYEVKTAFTLGEARSLLRDVVPDVILLDVKLPDGSSFDLCREIRESVDSYIIFLTSVTESSGELDGLTAGGDDYLRKPYGRALLHERVKKGLRHAKKLDQQLRRGSLTLDILSTRAFINNVDMGLKPTEFSLLLVLVQNNGKPVSAESLYRKAWNMPLAGDKNALYTALSRLRNRIDSAGYDIELDRSDGYYLIKK